jgi:hypothetical protein
MELWTRVNLIEASPHEPATAYLAVNRYQLDDFRPYIYKTVDYGKTWSLVSSGIPSEAFVRVVREDPGRKGLLYAGTETGVYVSFDDGADWQSLQFNLPAVPITDLTVKNGDLVAATQGRAFWILDDLTPIRRLTEEVVASKVHMFEPRDTYRMRSFRRPIPGVGQNPPGGVVLHYYLQEESKDVVLELIDEKGRRIKSFSGEAVPSAKGLNRFEWDMRYPDARGLEGRRTYLFGGSLRGPVAVPGRYEARLTAAGETRSRPFEIKKDPRLTSTAEDFQEQFDLMIQIRDRVSAAHDAANRIFSLREQIDVIEKRAGEDILAETKNLSAKLSAILSELVELRFEGIDDQMLVYPLKLNVAIASLQRAVASADRAPTDQTYTVFKERSAELDEELEKLSVVLEKDIPALNTMLRDAGLPTISIE